MNVENTLMDNELFYEPEDGFWLETDKLMFETLNLEAEWPKPGNPFITMMADPARVLRGIQKIGVSDFKQIVGALIEAEPNAVYRFLVIPLQRNAQSISVKLICKARAELPPLRADNSCSLGLAIEWMAKRYSHFEMSCAADGNYWVHKR